MDKYTQKGFTLVEVSMVGLFIVILGFGIVGIQSILGKSQLTLINNTISVEETSRIANEFVKELRTARQGDNGAFTIETAENNKITFYSDIDKDGKAEKVTYELNENTFTKTTIKPSGNPPVYNPDDAKSINLSDNVRNHDMPAFFYYNQDWPEDTEGNPMPTPADLDKIKLVQIYIRVNPKENSPDTDYVISSQAQIRTLTIIR